MHNEDEEEEKLEYSQRLENKKKTYDFEFCFQFCHGDESVYSPNSDQLDKRNEV